MDHYERSHAAINDWEKIVEYTLDRYGIDQTEKYMKGLINCIEALAASKGYFKEVKIKGRIVLIKHCQKHYIFGLVRRSKPLMIIAFLHERMDLITRLKRRLQ